MKILLVTRGSQGDVLPYLAIAAELERRGHEVTINLPHVAQISVTPRNPNSIAIGSIPQTYFSIYTTAAVSAHNITGRIERQLNEEEILEPERNQTADLRISCSAEAYPTAHSILIALGGSQLQNWAA